ncbi:MAG: type II CAAX endopeptidase family protein [Balneolales bacterium]
MTDHKSNEQNASNNDHPADDHTPASDWFSTGFLHEKSWLERHGFPHWLMAFLWVVVSFLLFQLVGTLLMVIVMLTVFDTPPTGFDLEIIVEHLDIVFIGNSLSQILFLGLMTWLITGLSTVQGRAAFLRFRADERTLPVSFYTVLLMITIQPIIWMLSWMNAQVPLPDGYMAFEENQMDMLIDFLTGDHLVWLTIIHVGLVPSVCEEILYRGYVQRALEKSWGIWAAILISGLLFGLYHLRLTQVIPLALIGVLLAWIVWKSNSIYPAMIGHFVNNGGSVLLATRYPDYMLEQITASELPPVWLVLISTGASVMFLRQIHQITRRE